MTLASPVAAVPLTPCSTGVRVQCQLPGARVRVFGTTLGSGANAHVYAPYLVRRWFKWDRSTRKATLYYTLSVFDTPNNQVRYQPQLMRSEISC